jgi:hypothetical protein
MLKKICDVLVLSFLLISAGWACNSTRLDSDVETMHTRIWRGLDITESDVRESLNFLDDEEKFREYKDLEFGKTIESKKNSIDNQNYHAFSEICKKIYQENIDEKQIAISIFFNEVSKRYEAYYNLQKEIEQSNAVAASREIDVDQYLRDFRKRKAPTRTIVRKEKMPIVSAGTKSEPIQKEKRDNTGLIRVSKDDMQATQVGRYNYDIAQVPFSSSMNLSPNHYVIATK